MNVKISVPDNVIYTYLKERNQALTGVSPSHQIDTELGALMKYYCVLSLHVTINLLDIAITMLWR